MYNEQVSHQSQRNNITAKTKSQTKFSKKTSFQIKAKNKLVKSKKKKTSYTIYFISAHNFFIFLNRLFGHLFYILFDLFYYVCSFIACQHSMGYTCNKTTTPPICHESPPSQTTNPPSYFATTKGSAMTPVHATTS